MTFINISTDKAADPISVLGKTKLFAEKLTAGYSSSNNDTKIRFLSVRFGNVFGSRGSVIHTFLKQIEQGGPVTITDPMVKRYFMTIEDAVHLVLRAATQGESGDTLILRMGDPVPIMDIANKLIKSSGKEIKLRFTSLRPGEKLNELLVGKNEHILESDFSEIMRVKVDPIKPQDASKHWQELN
jgi:FlaA1/EpsC-like NDP-sugar epimerase